jgi:hypothetical protein
MSGEKLPIFEEDHTLAQEVRHGACIFPKCLM